MKTAKEFRALIEPCRKMSVAQRRAFAKKHVKLLNQLVACASSSDKLNRKEAVHLFGIANDAVDALEMLQVALKGSQPSDFVKLRFNLTALTVTSKHVSRLQFQHFYFVQIIKL